MRYMQRREDSEYLMFPPAIYDELKRRYTERIEEMIAYATNDDICRSRQLLRYFGETDSNDCGNCDVCMQHNGHQADEDQVAEAKSMILGLLADGQTKHISVLHSINLPYPVLEEALEELIDEEIIVNDDGMLNRP